MKGMLGTHGSRCVVATVVQARLGSSRLPNKMLMELIPGETMLSVMVKRLAETIDKENIVLATTENPLDLPLISASEELGIKSFTGSENDVLQRFIDAADYFKLDGIVRVCGDNPFISGRHILELTELVQTDPSLEYVYFRTQSGLPAILSHSGLFAEYVSVSALKRIAAESNEAKYHEHLTLFILDNMSSFKCQHIDVPASVDSLPYLRLTVDRDADFQVCQKLYKELNNLHAGVEAVISAVQQRPDLYQTMKNSILENPK
jgi:spore coat polysaccharide biosynthesis protein SpsF